MNMIKLSLIALAAAVLTGCASFRPTFDAEVVGEAKVSETISKNFDKVSAPDGAPIAIAVYGFTDKTGQRKPSNLSLIHI